MDINNIRKIRFEFRKLTIYYKPPKESEEIQINYSDIPDLHKEIINFITSFVNKYSLYFGSYCSQCGNCCKQENILITGGDLFSIARHLGITEKEFYDKYLTTAKSWSRYDGFIKLIDGKCPFLIEKPTDRYNCSIYEYRPQSCRLYRATSSLCYKKQEDLIEQISYLDIEDDKISLKFHSGEFYNHLPVEEIKEEYLNILNILSELKQDEANKTKTILGKVRDILNEVKTGEYPLENFKKNINKLREILSTISDQRVIYTREIDELWTIISKLEMDDINNISQDDITVSKENTPENLFSIDKFYLKEIMFCPLTMTLIYKVNNQEYNYIIKYSEDRTILKNITSFMKDICLFIKEKHPRVLDNHTKKCYICGLCCRIFFVEIEPSDIRRLADNFNMTEEEFRKEYIEPPKYSWNPGSGLIKKNLDKNNQKKCVFLEKGDLDLYYCSVHAFKPNLCREYIPGKPQCYRSITDDLYYRLLSNIQNIYLDSKTIRIDTPYTYSKLQKPLTINRGEYKELNNSIEKLLKSLKNFLLKKYFSETKKDRKKDGKL